ncbi:MAG: DUF4878 domain-containing protein [Ardenticatenales bacterium]|nr:DUF4878 domain-containing protein [Ardenticatenales bacterium]
MNVKNCLFLILLSLSLLMTGCGFFASGPGQTVENFYRSVEEGNLDDATALLSSRLVSTIGASKIKQGLAQQTQTIKDKGGIESISVDSEEVTGEIAQVTTTITYGNGETGTETVNLMKEDGSWKLDPQK